MINSECWGFSHFSIDFLRKNIIFLIVQGYNPKTLGQAPKTTDYHAVAFEIVRQEGLYNMLSPDARQEINRLLLGQTSLTFRLVRKFLSVGSEFLSVGSDK